MTTASPTPPEPAELEALVAFAHSEYQAGRLVEAAETYRKILALRPDIAEAHNNLGNVLRTLGQFDEAIAQFQRALALDPRLVPAHNNLGRVLWERGQRDRAVAHLRQVVALQPGYAEAHNNLGNMLRELGRPNEAVAQFQQAVALKPDFFQAHNGLAAIFCEQGKFDQSVASYLQAIAIRPGSAETHNNLGFALACLGNLDAATIHCERALAINPGFYPAHKNLSNIFRTRGNLDVAIAHCQRALAIKPDYAEAHKFLGHALMQQAKFDEAASRYEQVLALGGDTSEAELSLAACRLIQGDYKRGWPAYEARLRSPRRQLPPNLPARWSGEPLAGRSLLLVAEQGLGDTLHFLRYARLLKERGARVVLACPTALGRLLATHPDLDGLYLPGSGKGVPQCDFYLPLASAPGAFTTDAQTIPCQVPYVWAAPDLTDKWRQELSAMGGFKIGIAWQGSPEFGMDAWRSIPLARFAPLASLGGVRLISLQKGFGSEQLATVDFPVLDLARRLDEGAGPFMDTAAVIRNLDLVVAADTAIAHLAGALGAPVWLALGFAPDWRWLLGRDDSPWYPTARLFRQQTPDGWPDLFERMATAVQAHRSETA